MQNQDPNDIVVDDTAVEVEQKPEGEQEQEQEQEVGELVVTIGDEVDPEEEEAKTAPEWVKNLRKRVREQDSLIRKMEEARKKIQAESQPVTLRKKPQLHDDGIEYDEEKFAAALLEWNEEKRKVEEKQREKQEEAEAADRAFSERVKKYEESKSSLKVDDFKHAEDTAFSTLSQVQQGLLVNYADKPELVVYALGRNDKELKRLSAIKDPIAFAIAIKDLEREKIKVTTRKPETSPERTLSGSASATSSVDKHLEKLEAEAEKTGDRSKIVAYKRSLKSK